MKKTVKRQLAKITMTLPCNQAIPSLVEINNNRDVLFDYINERFLVLTNGY